MPNPQHDQRLNVLAAGDKGGWKRDSGVFDESNIVRDTFTGPLGQVRVVWIRTPWSLSGRFAGALFSDPKTKADRNVWKVTGTGGLIELLGGTLP